MQIDVTTTAICRPKLIERTFESFTTNLLNGEHDYRLVINIDPYGDDKDGERFKQVLKICYKYFKRVKYNVPNVSLYSRAAKWVWDNCNAEYVFNLQDDWIMLREIDINIMIKHLAANDKLASMRLGAKWLSECVGRRIFGCTLDGEARGYMWSNFCGMLGMNPALIKGEYVKAIAPHMVEHMGVERQIKSHYQHHVQKNKKYIFGVFGNPRQKQIVKDTGIPWRQGRGVRKNSDGNFTYYKENSDIKGLQI